LAPAAAWGSGSGTWATAVKIDDIPGNSPELNGPAMDGCPIQSPDGRSLYFASNREGSRGLDIWVSHRRHAGWGPPENLGEPVNSASDDFCPTPIRGGGLFFVSREALPGACGLGDIYFTRYTRRHGWREPVHLACAPSGPNTALDEQGPSYVKGSLYFSSSTLPPATSGETFVSRGHPLWGFGPATPLAELNDPAANDIQPNVRSDGLEVVFSSTRAGTPDIWVATRRSRHDRWSAPVALGPEVNTSAGETRPSLSWDGRTLLFGRSPGPEGQSDIYVTTRALHRRS
jgi:hypothetical protein